jgi:hypothetical protein
VQQDTFGSMLASINGRSEPDSFTGLAGAKLSEEDGGN